MKQGNLKMKTRIFAYYGYDNFSRREMELAREAGITLQHIGDIDTFYTTPSDIKRLGNFDGIVTRNPIMVVRMVSTFDIGIFQYDHDTGEAVDLHLYAARPSVQQRYRIFYHHDAENA